LSPLKTVVPIYYSPDKVLLVDFEYCSPDKNLKLKNKSLKKEMKTSPRLKLKQIQSVVTKTKNGQKSSPLQN